MSMKNPLTPAGIEPATFRFVAQHLNRCATAVNFIFSKNKSKIYFCVNSASSHKIVTAEQIKDSESTCFGFEVYQDQMPFVQE